MLSNTRAPRLGLLGALVVLVLVLAPAAAMASSGSGMTDRCPPPPPPRHGSTPGSGGSAPPGGAPQSPTKASTRVTTPTAVAPADQGGSAGTDSTKSGSAGTDSTSSGSAGTDSTSTKSGSAGTDSTKSGSAGNDSVVLRSPVRYLGATDVQTMACPHPWHRGHLPFTGANSLPLLGAGLSLVAVGAVGVRVSRRLGSGRSR